VIIWLASYPRSGNTFFRIVAHQLYGIPTYSGFRSGGNGACRHITGHKRLPEALYRALLEGDKTTYMKYHDSEDFFLIKAHSTLDELRASELPSIVLVRDARDALISFTWYWMEYGHVWRKDRLKLAFETSMKFFGFKQTLFHRILNQHLNNRYWINFYEGWRHKQEGNTHFLRFEDLTTDPVESVHNALKGVGVELNLYNAEIPTFDELQKLSPGFFRQGKAGAWEKEFPSNLYDQFWETHGPTMRALGYNH